MKTIRIFITSFFASFFLISGLWAQQDSCYMRMEDASGYTPTSEQVAKLEAAAAELCAVFDSAGFSGQFKVYDFGFYLHQEVTDGGYPEPFAKKILEVQELTTYYLLFGKQTDRSGVYTRFWVSLNLPQSILCAGDNQEIVLSDNIRWILEDNYDKDLKDPAMYASAEIESMNLFKNKITDLLICCDQNRNINVNLCSDCPDDESIKRLFMEKGFTMIDIDSVSINIPTSLKNNKTQIQEKMQFSGLIDGISEIIIWIEGIPWDLNQGLNDEISSYPHESKKGVVASNEDMCLTDLYEKIRQDYYKNFEVAIIDFVWIKKDQQDNVIDKKLFFKKYFPIPDFQIEPEIIQEVGFLLQCHPSMGWLNSVCTPYSLPINYNDITNGAYAISSEVGGDKYFGFVYDASQFHWDQKEIVECEKPIDPIQSDRDNTYADCDFYTNVDEWSNFAKEMRNASTKELVEDFQTWTTNNMLVLLSSDLKRIANNFYYGKGSPLIWNCNDAFSKYIASRENIRQFLFYLQGLCYDWLSTHNNFDNFMETYSNTILDNAPINIPAPAESPITHATAAIAIGGIHGWKVGIINLKKIACTVGQHTRCYEVELHLTLQDIFGAGDDDRDRGGPWHSRIPYIGDGRIPGLTQLWLLQHCRNLDCEAIGGTPPCFVPFEHVVNFGHKFKLCYENDLDP